MKLLRVLFLMSGIATQAATTIEREFTCPLDQHRWTQRVEASGRADALRLDSREMGRDVVQPPTLPQCPKCRFIIFDATLDEAAVRRIKGLVASPDYKTLAAKSTPYLCLATIQETLEAPAFHIGYSYLRASWAAEASESQCRRLLTLSRSHFIRALAQMKPEGRDFINIGLTCGEIERRLGKWDEATARFLTLRPVIDAEAPKYEAIVSQQLALIVRHDPRPHLIGAHPDAPPALAGTYGGSKATLRDEALPVVPVQKPESAPVSKVPDLGRPFAAGGAGRDVLTLRPLMVKVPVTSNVEDLPNADAVTADSPPPIEVQPVPEGLPDAEPLPKPTPADKGKVRPIKKGRTQASDDKKNLKPKQKSGP